MPKQKPPTSRPSQFSSVQVGCAGERKGRGNLTTVRNLGNVRNLSDLTNFIVRTILWENCVNQRLIPPLPLPSPTHQPLYACHHLWHLKRTLKNLLLLSNAVEKRTWAMGSCHNELSLIICHNADEFQRTSTPLFNDMSCFLWADFDWLTLQSSRGSASSYGVWIYGILL